MEEFKNFEKAILNIYNVHKLNYIDEHIYDSKDGINFFSDIIRSKENIKEFPYSDFKLYDEFKSISGDLKYITAYLILVYPFVNRVTREGMYDQTKEDRRYLMYSNWGIQTIYNFWDRIGDLLTYFFETDLEERQIYTGSVLNSLENDIKKSKNYNDLLNLFDNSRQIFRMRNHSVHYFQLEVKHMYDYLEGRTKDNESEIIKKLEDEKLNYKEILIKSLDSTKNAFYFALKLIEEKAPNCRIIAEQD